MAAQPGVQIAATTPSRKPVPMDGKRNIFVFIGDAVTFLTGLSFIPATTVLVGLASSLTDNKALIGVVAMSWSVAWLIPQLFAARLVHGKRRQKPYLIIPSIIGRQMMLLFAIWLALSNAQPPLFTVWLLIGSVVVFNFCDAIAGISYWDMLSRVLTPQRRGRTITTGQFFGSLLGVGSALIVERVLAPGGLPFPLNYALIFVFAWLGFIASLIIICFLQENPLSEEALAQAHEEGAFFTHVHEALRSDEIYRRLLAVRLLTGVESMTAAFYVVFIKERLALPDSIIGIFSVALIIGGIAGVALFGAISDRSGSRGVIRFAAFLQLLAPLLALGMTVLPGLMEAAPTVVVAVFAVILAIDGAIGRSTMLGFSSYALDRAPERRRAIYVGVFNTLGGIVGLTPVLGGFYLDQTVGTLGNTPAYALMFGVAALCAGVGTLLGFTLPKPALMPD
jgi:MFS family permease